MNRPDNAILVVDDDPEIRDVIHVYLRNEGYRVIEAADGREAVDIAADTPPALIILDVMMPRMDGIRACMAIREFSQVPIIMLSAKEEDIDKITGLSTGADDYVAKPFSPMELMARVKAQLRRQRYAAREAGESSVIRIKDLAIDPAQHRVTIRDRDVPLTPLEFKILAFLATRRGQVFSAEQIYDSVWKEPAGYAENTVMVHIRNLREKLEERPREPQYIKTVWGVGYKIEK